MIYFMSILISSHRVSMIWIELTSLKYQIDTGDAPPMRQRPHRLPLARRGEAMKAIEEMQQLEVIEPSASPWLSPVVLVNKKDGIYNQTLCGLP